MEQPVQVGDKIRLALAAEPCVAPLGEGEVMWVEPDRHSRPTLGIRFITLEPSGRRMIESIVKHGGNDNRLAPELGEEPVTEPGSN
jgi:hypothetical protein